MGERIGTTVGGSTGDTTVQGLGGQVSKFRHTPCHITVPMEALPGPRPV